MIKSANTTAKTDWPQVVELCSSTGHEFDRPAPAEPLAFFASHEHGDKLYTNGADRDTIVAPKFKQTIFEVLGGVRALNFNRLGWSDAEAKKLAVVLPLCRQLTSLELVSNTIGDEGLVALVDGLGAFGSLPKLRKLVLSYNNYGGVGMRALASLLQDAKHLPSLKVLWLTQNHTGLNAACKARSIRVEVAGSRRFQEVQDDGGGDELGEASVRSAVYNSPTRKAEEGGELMEASWRQRDAMEA